MNTSIKKEKLLADLEELNSKKDSKKVLMQRGRVEAQLKDLTLEENRVAGDRRFTQT